MLRNNIKNDHNNFQDIVRHIYLNKKNNHQDILDYNHPIMYLQLLQSNLYIFHLILQKQFLKILIKL